MGNLSYEIRERVTALSPEMQAEVLRYIEFLLLKKNETDKNLPNYTVFNFIGKGSSNGAVNQIANIRDFAYDD